MTPGLILLVLGLYFSLLMVVAYLTSRKADQSSFYIGNRNSRWYLVAFGMIGASLSGVTFMSVPGAVGDGGFHYFQIVLGYLAGYLVIIRLLLPLYYRMQLTSIYEYLEQRFGSVTHRSGAGLFLISRVLGASFRLYLVAIVLNKFILEPFGLPFWVAVVATIVLIWIYSFQGGIKTIVWTDTLQTTFMLLSVVVTLIYITGQLDLNVSETIGTVRNSAYSSMFEWHWQPANSFYKYFLSGMFITIVMTGLDQDMMQKNLSCRNLEESQKNMRWMSISLLPINLLFLVLRALLYIFLEQNNTDHAVFGPDCQIAIGDDCIRKDSLFASLSITVFPVWMGIVFLLGLTAAAYSSADSALTALTTSFCLDILQHKEHTVPVRLRYLVHAGFSVLLVLVILIFRNLNNESVINELFTVAGYTYGPLLGLFAFGMFTRRQVKDAWVPVVCILSPVACYFLNKYDTQLLGGYQFGFELLLVNGALAWMLLYFISKKPEDVR